MGLFHLTRETISRQKINGDGMEELGTAVETGLQVGGLTLASRYFLSPLAGYTNWPFRRALRELGGLGLATTELVNARALIKSSLRSMELIETCPLDRPLAVQIYGADAGEMSEAARWLEGYGASAIDINMGCPVHKVTRGGGGSALMCNVSGTVALVKAVVEAVQIPVTVKMRLGWDDASWSAPFFAKEFEQVGVAAIIVHGRTREQGFSGKVNLEGIRAVVEAVERVPIIGNGDIRTLADAQRMLEFTGCTGVAIGRGALLNPWIFTQLQRWETTGEVGELPSYADRLDFMSRHFHLLVEQRGERYACLTFRKVANWYCRVLKPGHELQQRFVKVEKVADFDGMVGQLRERGAPAHWERDCQVAIAVPKGPNERW
jgi:tRNA-dihydrouridine synthase B